MLNDQHHNELSVTKESCSHTRKPRIVLDKRRRYLKLETSVGSSVSTTKPDTDKELGQGTYRSLGKGTNSKVYFGEHSMDEFKPGGKINFRVHHTCSD